MHEIALFVEDDRAMRADRSLQRFVEQLRDIFRGWAR